MAYIGSTPTTQSFISGTDYFNGTGSQTAFTLTRTVNSVNDIEAVVNNVVQQPNSAYTLSGTTITFTSAPSSGTSNIYVRYLSTTMQSFTVPANSITRNQLDSNLQSVVVGRNRIINGAMVIDQRNAGASVTPTAATYTLDRWTTTLSQASKFSIQQDAGAVTPPVGFNDYLGVTSLSAYTVGATETFGVRQLIEGYNIADLGWGTANAKTVTLSFWVRSSLTGTFGGALRNSAADRSYPFSYTISAANTWEQKSVTIAGETTGTWLTTNGVGITLIFGLGAGADRSGTAGAWSAGTALSSVTGATSVVGTNGATWYVTGVQLEVGTQATSFEYRQYQQELALCQRYCFVLSATAEADFGVGACTSGGVQAMYQYPTTMRTAPSVTYTAANTLSIADGTAGYTCTVLALKSASPNQFTTNATASGTTGGRAGILRWNSGTATITSSAEL